MELKLAYESSRSARILNNSPLLYQVKVLIITYVVFHPGWVGSCAAFCNWRGYHIGYQCARRELCELREVSMCLMRIPSTPLQLHKA